MTTNGLLARTIVPALIFGLMLTVAALHERSRRGVSALWAPANLRAALGNALIEALVMLGAAVVAMVAIATRGN